MNIFILGANGFIGSHLTEAILAETDWQITAIDLTQDKLAPATLAHPRLQFKRGDMLQEANWVTEQIQACDVVLPLVAIATPALYVQDPLRIFELDFEANLKIIRQCVTYQKRIVFPSTSEVYGMCPDAMFDEEKSPLVTGPINKERWIYSTSKQLLDRLLFAYGKHHGLAYSAFRPFNWYGPRLDNVHNPKPGGSRVLTQFIGNILRGEPIQLVGGGAQKRCFTYISDGIDAIVRIIENKNEAAHQRIFNVGNPHENISIRELAEQVLRLIKAHYPHHANQAEKTQLIDVDAGTYYGEGYQDVTLRVPAIEQARTHLEWKPIVGIEEGLRKVLDYYLS